MSRIRRTTELTNGLRMLAAVSHEEGFGFLDRLLREWENGTNMFDQPGETFLGYFDRGLVAIGGLNVDPFIAIPSIGRLRHLYVIPWRRESGLGKAIVTALLDHGRRSFSRVRLRTDSSPASCFYTSLGFSRIDEPHATHAIDL